MGLRGPEGETNINQNNHAFNFETPTFRYAEFLSLVPEKVWCQFLDSAIKYFGGAPMKAISEELEVSTIFSQYRMLKGIKERNNNTGDVFCEVNILAIIKIKSALK